MNKITTIGPKILNITNGDIPINNLLEMTERQARLFLFEYTNIKLLLIRTFDVIDSLRLDKNMFNGVRIVEKNNIETLLDLTKTEIINIKTQNEQPNFLFEKRIINLILLLHDITPYFINEMKQYCRNGIDNSTALNEAYKHTILLLDQKMKIQNLFTIEIITKINMMKFVKNRKIVNNVYELLTFKFE